MLSLDWPLPLLTSTVRDLQYRLLFAPVLDYDLGPARAGELLKARWLLPLRVPPAYLMAAQTRLDKCDQDRGFRLTNSWSKHPYVTLGTHSAERERAVHIVGLIPACSADPHAGEAGSLRGNFSSQEGR